MRGIIVPADSKRRALAVTIRDTDMDAMLADIVGMVGGFERVRVGDFRTREMFGSEELWLIMVVDDNGALVGKPSNVRASILYGAPIHGNDIYGDALLLGEHFAGAGPEFVDLPDQFADPVQWDLWFSEVAAQLLSLREPS